MTLIVAPAGFGKSSALRDFIESSALTAVRYDVHREDHTLLEFVHRFAEALESVAPTALAAFPAMQERVMASDAPVRQISDWLAEHLKNVACTVVIDDLHFAAADPASIALIADVIERTAERIRWIVASRSDVGLPVGTWIAYGRMDLPIGEDDLRFTTEEAMATAGGGDGEIDPQEIESLRQLTEGWPVALTIAMRTRTHARDLRTAAFSTREMIYRYLAEQVFNGLSLPERAFALSTAVFPSFDFAVAEQFGGNAQFIKELRNKIAFLNEIEPGRYRYHDLFRDFLEAELRRAGTAEWTKTVSQAAVLLETQGDYGTALSLYTKANAGDEILRVLDEHGFALFERGESARLAGALEIVDERDIASHAAAAGLLAVIESGRGRFALVESRFVTAIDGARGDLSLKLTLVHRYAIELVRHERDCIALLEPYAFDESLTQGQRAPLLGTLATAYVRASRYHDAVATIERAIAGIDAGTSAEFTARLYQQAAFVYHNGPDAEKARTYAHAAIDFALAHDLYEVAARAYTVLYNVALIVEDDPVAALAMLDRVEENAVKSASQQAHIFALISAYDIEADRGDDAALERLDTALHDAEGLLPRARFEALAPASALRRSWTGDFAGAAVILKDTLAAITAPDRRALRAAEIALYCAAAGDAQAADEAGSQAAQALDVAKEHNRRTLRARCLLALSELLRGHESAANRLLVDAERHAAKRLRTLLAAVRTLYRFQLGQAQQTDLDAALARLNDEQFAGLARLFGALPLKSSSSSGAIGALTATEREILAMLAKGASTKDVAAGTGRSPHTIDTHIRSICRKLGCSGRREAVALATSRGWVEP